MDDPFNLERFRIAQDEDGTYAQALNELKSGQKRSHWMWFVFPQLAGLGRSQTAVFFAISSKAEAMAYLQHPILGKRLLDCTRTLTGLTGRNAVQVFGSVDAQKLRSSMTLFAVADPAEALFAQVLDRYFDGQPDPLTERLLAGQE
ncbi:MAG: hypothetical protein JWO93_2294 [Micrococcaceae bacterium]|nr:hypothetical protein [Micrococcaceae bacterium]